MTTGYYLKYQALFSSAPPSESNDAAISYRIGLWFAGYGGPVIDLVCGGVPLLLETVDNSDTPFTPVWSQKATIELLCDDKLTLDDLLNADRVGVTVEFWSAGAWSRQWTGWQSDTVQEPYETKPYLAQLTALCGLAELKDVPLLTGTGARLKGPQSLLSLHQTALLRIGYELGLYAVDNLTERADMMLNALPNPANAPLERTKVAAELFADERGNPAFTYDTLDQLATSRQARLTQWSGSWRLLRIPEMAGGWNPAGSDRSMLARYYQNGNMAWSMDDCNVVIAPGQRRAATGGVQNYQAKEKRLSVRQDFGRRINRLPNGDFVVADNTGFAFGWIRNRLSATGTNLSAVRLGTGVEADPYRVRIYGVASPAADQGKEYIWESVTLPPYKKGTGLKLTGRFKLQNTRSAMLLIFGKFQAAPSDQNNGRMMWLTQEKTWSFSPKRKDMQCFVFDNVDRVVGIEEGKPGWQRTRYGWADLDFDLDPGPFISEIQVCLCIAQSLDGQTSTPQPFVEYADFDIVPTTTDAAQPTGQYVTRGTDKAQILTPDSQALTVYMGDVPDSAAPLEHYGTLYRADGVTPTQRWFHPAENPLPGLGNGGTLVDWSDRERYRAVAKRARTFDGQIVGNLINGPLSVLRFADILGADNQPVPFLITKWKWNVRMHLHSVTAVEWPTEIGHLSTRHWDTADGPVPQQVDSATGEPVTTTNRLDNVTQQLLDALKPVIGQIPFVPKPSLVKPNFVGIDPAEGGKYTLIAQVKRNNLIIGNVKATLRKLFPFPL